MPRGVYERQQKRLGVGALRVWLFITQYVEKRGLPPTYREIAAGCYISKTTVGTHLLRLEARGYIDRGDGAARGIILLEKPNRHIKTPE